MASPFFLSQSPFLTSFSRDSITYKFTLYIYIYVYIYIYIFQLQFTFNIILYWFRVYSTVGRQWHSLQRSQCFQHQPGTIRSYYNSIDSIPYAALYILIIIS